MATASVKVETRIRGMWALNLCVFLSPVLVRLTNARAVIWLANLLARRVRLYARIGRGRWQLVPCNTPQIRLVQAPESP